MAIEDTVEEEILTEPEEPEEAESVFSEEEETRSHRRTPVSVLPEISPKSLSINAAAWSRLTAEVHAERFPEPNKVKGGTTGEYKVLLRSEKERLSLATPTTNTAGSLHIPSAFHVR